eukprot:gb/GECH01002424.1/.p1 GENE.gb/GECH01002424.1/~~gb/GECH01002424.1/.p1  ORF type:complete len:106 (+),score=26.73 gb/GECH01002424.1/:1-318(+)
MLESFFFHCNKSNTYTMAKKKPFSGKQKKEQLKQKRQKQEQKKEKKEKQLEKAFSSDILNDDNCNEPNEIDSDSSRKNSKLSPNVTSVVTSNSNKYVMFILLVKY